VEKFIKKNQKKKKISSPQGETKSLKLYLQRRQMSEPIVLPYPEFLKKIKPFIGSYIKFLYIREPDSKKWKFASLYLCLEDTMEDRKLYEKEETEVDFREKPISGERRAVEELNENLKGTGVKIIRFIEHECKHHEPGIGASLCKDGFFLSVEIL